MRKVSAAALQAARDVLREYALEIRPEYAGKAMTNTEGHVAIVIDYATGVYKIAELRPELAYWQKQILAKTATAPQLIGFLKRLLETLGQIPRYGRNEELVQVAMRLPREWAMVIGPQTQVITKAALEAARYLMHYYIITPLALPSSGGNGVASARIDSVQVARLVNLNLGVSHALQAIPLAEAYLQRLNNGKADQKEIKFCFRDLDIYLSVLPAWSRTEEVMLLVP
jgi:hypothetical protein